MAWRGVEKRRFPRAKFPCKITLYLPCEHVVLTHTENIGSGGVRVIIEENLAISSVVGLEIITAQAQLPIQCRGKVVWSLENRSPLDDEVFLFDTGLELIDIKDVDRETIAQLVEVLLENE